MGCTKPIGYTVLVLILVAYTANCQDPNSLSDEERSAGWQLLFDGRTTQGWRAYKGESVPSCWKIEDGVLLSRPQEGDSRGDIITVEQFADFELVWQWRMSPGGNSGLIYRATEEYSQVWQSGPEYQILDNQRHLDGLNPLASAGACYAVFAPARDATRPVGQWNESRVLAQSNHVEHWLNGEKLLEYDVGTPKWIAHVKTSKFYSTAYGQGSWGKAPRGHIGLQDYGGAIGFRAIKIRLLNGQPRR